MAKITTRARDAHSDRVSIWMGAAGPVKTYDFHDSRLSPAERHKLAASRWEKLQTGMMPTFKSTQVGLGPKPYQRETWVHEAK